MKRLLLLSAAVFALTACGNSTPGPAQSAASVTGYWDVALTSSGKTFAANASLSQTNSPNAGDFTGIFTAPGIDGSASVTGNRNTGKITSTNDTGSSVTCTGAFNGGASYKGDCTLKTSGGPDTQASIVMNKR